MPYLGDYLGQLLAEITMARMHADLETVRLAELYASHPLLKTLPVPHVRLPSVDVDVPVLIKQSEEPVKGQSPRGGVPLAAMQAKFSEALTAHLERAGQPLKPAERKRIEAALAIRTSRVDLPAEMAVDVHRVADEFVETAMQELSQLRPAAPGGREIPPGVSAAQLKESIRVEFLKLRAQPPRLMVLVTGSEIREAGSADNLTRLRLKITEQGVEWTSVESEGRQQDRLVPE